MIAALQNIVDEMCETYRHGGSLVLLFDYDGTLTPIVAHPRLAVLDRKTRRLLASLADRPRIHIGILSGRELDELRSVVKVSGLYLAGTGGLELELRGFRIIHPHTNRMAETIQQLAQQLEGQVTAYQGAWLEKKRLGLTVHYRLLPGQLLGSLQAAVTDITRSFANDIRVSQGPKAWEITPARGWNKGTAVQLIRVDIGKTPDVILYAGDGANDAEAFQEIAAMGGVTLGVGADAPSSAVYRLPNQPALLSFLNDLDGSLEKRRPHSTRSSKDYVGLYGLWKSMFPANPM